MRVFLTVHSMITNDDILELLSSTVQSGKGIRIAVSGRSMGPGFVSVSDIQVVQCNPTSIPTGRLVVFQRDGRWIVHRVMRMKRGAEGVVYFTKGDGLAQVDQPLVRPEEIRGEVTELGLMDGTHIDLQSYKERFKARWIVIRWLCAGRLFSAAGQLLSRVPTGRGPRPEHPG